MLVPGDRLFVPGLHIAQIERSTDATHRLIVASEVELPVQLRLQARWQHALEGLTYTISFSHRGDEVTRPGATPVDASGVVEERVPVGVDVVMLFFERPKMEMRLLVSHLDPLREPDAEIAIESGLLARLSALGFHAPRKGDVRAAIADFQRAELGRAEPSGELDAETWQKLEELHGA